MDQRAAWRSRRGKAEVGLDCYSAWLLGRAGCGRHHGLGGELRLCQQEQQQQQQQQQQQVALWWRGRIPCLSGACANLQGELKTEQVEVIITYLKSYELMGKAKVACVSGCQ